MKTYQFTLTLDYQVQAENEASAICQIHDLIHRDWPDYLNEGEIIAITQEEQQ